MREALTLGNGLVSGGRGTDDSASPASLVNLPKSLRRVHKGFKAGLGAAKNVIKGRGTNNRKLLMKALPAGPAAEAPGPS